MLVITPRNGESPDSMGKRLRKKLILKKLVKLLERHRYHVKKSKKMALKRAGWLFRLRLQTQTNNKCGQSVIVVPKNVDIPVIAQES